MAGNQLGKTRAGGAEWAMHLTGRYPQWWQGKVFDTPVRLWAAGVTGEGTRDNPQRVLVGPPQQQAAWGTGMIPADAIRHAIMGAARRARSTASWCAMAAAAMCRPERACCRSRVSRRAARNGRARRCTASGSTRNRRLTSIPKA
nr:terminase family protein [Mesorhizobium huakuii]